MTDSEICTRLYRHAAEDPERPAVVSAEGTLPYRALAARVQRYAGALAEAGLGAGDVVAISLADGADAVAAVLAALAAGPALVWLDPEQPAGRHRIVTGDCNPGALLTSASVAIDVDGLLDDDAALIQVRGDTAQVLRSTAAPARPKVPADTGFLVYTSGSTGTPKGIVQRGANFDQLAPWLAAEFGIGAQSRLLQWGRYTYDAAYLEIATAICAGAALILPSATVKADGPRVGQWIEAHDVTHLITVPSLCRLLIQAREDADAPPLRALLGVGLFGEVLHERLVTRIRRQLPAAALYNLYGPTECILATYLRVPDRVLGTVPIGREMPGREIVLRGEDGREVPPGESGEIVIRSPYLAHGYLNLPEATSTAFQPDPDDPGRRQYRTGDLGRRLPDGGLDFLGRLDGQVKIRGARVELGEIETALYGDPVVAHAAVRVFGGDRDSLTATAYVQPRRGAAVRVADLHRTLARTLPGYMLPANYVIVESMPLTSTGKIDHLRLPEPDALAHPGGADGEDREPPATETERLLAEIWCEVLGRGEVGRDDVFFTIGGHSLLVPQVTAKVQEVLGVEVPVRAAFEYPSLWELAEHIDDLRQQAATEAG
jgi:amino acid adenylation domain-containing protein